MHSDFLFKWFLRMLSNRYLSTTHDVINFHKMHREKLVWINNHFIKYSVQKNDKQSYKTQTIIKYTSWRNVNALKMLRLFQYMKLRILTKLLPLVLNLKVYKLIHYRNHISPSHFLWVLFLIDNCWVVSLTFCS